MMSGNAIFNIFDKIFFTLSQLFKKEYFPFNVDKISIKFRFFEDKTTLLALSYNKIQQKYTFITSEIQGSPLRGS